MGSLNLPGGAIETPITISESTVQNLVGPQGGKPRSQVTSDLWSLAVLVQMNVDGVKTPLTLNNVENVMRWVQKEGGSGGGWAAHNDPLNVRNLSQGGAFQFPDLVSGVKATAATIEQSNMTPIRAALQQDASTQVFGQALVASPWDQSHYDYKNPVVGVTPTVLYATGSGGNPTGTLGQIAPNPAPVITGPTTAVGQAANDLAPWAAPLAHLLGNLTSVAWWDRVGLFALGLFLFLIGLFGFISTTQTGQKIESTAAVAAMA